jgi:hypothetical protein
MALRWAQPAAAAAAASAKVVKAAKAACRWNFGLVYLTHARRSKEEEEEAIDTSAQSKH